MITFDEIKRLFEEMCIGLDVDVHDDKTIDVRFNNIIGHALELKASGFLENGGMPLFWDDTSFIFTENITMCDNIYKIDKDELERLCECMKEYINNVCKEIRNQKKQRRINLIREL